MKDLFRIKARSMDLLRLNTVLSVEALNSSCCVDKLLLTGEEGVTL